NTGGAAARSLQGGNIRGLRYGRPFFAPSSGTGEPIVGVEGRRPVTFDDAAADEIDQMRMDRAPRGAAQPRLQADIEPFDDRVDLSHASGEAIENAGLALSAMGDEGADVGFGLGDRRAVGRPVDR